VIEDLQNFSTDSDDTSSLDHSITPTLDGMTSPFKIKTVANSPQK